MPGAGHLLLPLGSRHLTPSPLPAASITGCFSLRVKEENERKNKCAALYSGPCSIVTDEMGEAPRPVSKTSQKPVRMGKGEESFHASDSKLGAGGLPILPVQDCCKTTIWTNYCNYPPTSMEPSRTNQQTTGS